MTEMWGRVVLKSMDWVKREGTMVSWNRRNNFQQKKIYISDVYLKSYL